MEPIGILVLSGLITALIILGPFLMALWRGDDPRAQTLPWDCESDYDGDYVERERYNRMRGIR